MKRRLYSMIYSISEGRRGVEATFMDDDYNIIDSKWGFLDPDGNVKIDFVYQCVRGFKNGLAQVQKDEKWGLIDTSGNVIVPIIYQSLDRLDGYTQVQLNELWGLLTEQGEELIPCQYDYLSAPIEGIVKAQSDNKWFEIELPTHILGR